MEWKEVRLGDIVEIVNGFAFKSKAFTLEGIPVIKIKNIKAGKVILNDLDYISTSDINPKYTKIRSSDILITMTGNRMDGSPETWVGKVSLFRYQGDFYLNQRVSALRLIDDSVDNNFLSYYLSSWQSQLYFALNSNSSGGQANITPTVVQEYRLMVPGLEAQRSIASILSSLDRKIELNNKINADLEEMAQAIFKNWFVDFEPFKDGKFVNSELGMIPEGWKVSQIANIPHILETGKRPKGGAVEKGIPSVGAEHVKGMCAYDYSKTKYINCEFAAKLKTGKINGYELMIYKDGGKPGYFVPNFSIFGEGYPFDNCYLNEHVFKLDFDGNKGYNIFCYFFFKTEQIMSYFNSQGAKAAIPGINKKDVENIYIFTPDNKMVIKFGEFAYPLFKQMLKNAIENRSLSLLRDTLLPRLMSGEIEIPE